MMNKKELTEDEKIVRKKEIYQRFRSNFPPMSDRKFAAVVGLQPSAISHTIKGRNTLDIVANSERYPDLDWTYILTGQRSKGDALTLRLYQELHQTRSEIIRIANNLQNIEDKLSNI